MFQLRTKLKRLPQSDAEDAIAYYQGYFDDAGPENEQEVIEELGSPSEVAGKIIREFAFKQLENQPDSKKRNGAHRLGGADRPCVANRPAGWDRDPGCIFRGYCLGAWDSPWVGGRRAGGRGSGYIFRGRGDDEPCIRPGQHALLCGQGDDCAWFWRGNPLGGLLAGTYGGSRDFPPDGKMDETEV